MIRSALNSGRAAICLVALTALTLAASPARPVSAQNSWNLRLSEKEGELVHTGDPAWTNFLMWDIGFERMVCRNAPYFEITNASTSTLPVTKFKITIGDNRFNFAPVQGTSLVMLGSSTKNIPLTATTTNNLGDELVVDIGNSGLLPGQVVRFKVKIGVDASFAGTFAASFGSSLPDYRTVFFDSGGEVYGPSSNTDPNNPKADNSHAFVVFGSNTNSNTAIFDDVKEKPAFFNNILRPYSTMDGLGLFELTGVPIPEPTSAGLALLGIGGFFLKARSRNRRTAA